MQRRCPDRRESSRSDELVESGASRRACLWSRSVGNPPRVGHGWQCRMQGDAPFSTTSSPRDNPGLCIHMLLAFCANTYRLRDGSLTCGRDVQSRAISTRVHLRSEFIMSAIPKIYKISKHVGPSHQLGIKISKPLLRKLQRFLPQNGQKWRC